MSPVISNEAALNFFLHEGAVFYLQDRNLSSAEPHYFVILNHNPGAEEVLLLVVSSSQIESVKNRFAHLRLPETLVEIAKQDYAGFTKDSIISCNQVFMKNKQQLMQQINNGGNQGPRIPTAILQKLRQGVLKSPMVEGAVKKRLCPDGV